MNKWMSESIQLVLDILRQNCLGNPGDTSLPNCLGL